MTATAELSKEQKSALDTLGHAVREAQAIGEDCLNQIATSKKTASVVARITKTYHGALRAFIASKKQADLVYAAHLKRMIADPYDKRSPQEQVREDVAAITAIDHQLQKLEASMTESREARVWSSVLEQAAEWTRQMLAGSKKRTTVQSTADAIARTAETFDLPAAQRAVQALRKADQEACAELRKSIADRFLFLPVNSDGECVPVKRPRR